MVILICPFIEGKNKKISSKDAEFRPHSIEHQSVFIVSTIGEEKGWKLAI
jgi:hypothetical protein